MNIDTLNSQKYGIMISGGLDSAILLYLLVKSNPLINIQPFTIPKKDGAMIYANPIIDYINQIFNLSIPSTISVGDPSVHHRIQSKIAVEEIFKNYNIDTLFIAINQNPPELNDLPGAPMRDKKSNNSKIIFPFVDLYKDDILKLIIAENQISLIELTHSCTELSIGRCNQCWQCNERAWAFNKLNLVDSGTL
jgi:hypothetical protein